MATSFKIHDNAYDGFLALIEMGPGKVATLVRIMEGRELTLAVSTLIDELAAATEVPRDRMYKAVIDVLLPMNAARAEFEEEPADFLRSLEGEIGKQKSDWYEQHREGWRRVSDSLLPLLAPDNFFALLNKTFQLLINRPTQAVRFKVLTELRPVYGESAESIKAMVLTSTLVINYNEGTAARRLHLTVDQADLRELQAQLDRADRKVQTLAEQAGRLGLPVLVADIEQE